MKGLQQTSKYCIEKERKKNNIKTAGKPSGIFILSFPYYLLPNLAGVLKRAAPFPVWAPGPWFQRQQRPYSQIIVFVLICLRAS